jgi:hypothetical protein
MRHPMTSVAALLILATLGFAGAQAQTTPPRAGEGQPGSPQHQEQVDRALNTESGRAGKDEPLPNKDDTAVFVNGALNVPGAPADSQTVPAKYSARNDALDKLPTMATPLWLNDEQRKRIAATLRIGDAPAAAVDTPFAKELPLNVEMREIPDTLKREVPDVQTLKYARAGDRILLVDPSNRIVVGEIKE